MKIVPTKTAEQRDLQALHRVRERLVSQRYGIINQIRGFLLERGVAVRQGQRFLRAELPHILTTPPDVLSPRMVRVIEDLAGDWRRLDERIDGLSGEIEAIARQDAGCERLMSVPGIGPIISSAMVAAIGHVVFSAAAIQQRSDETELPSEPQRSYESSWRIATRFVSPRAGRFARATRLFRGDPIRHALRVLDHDHRICGARGRQRDENLVRSRNKQPAECVARRVSAFLCRSKSHCGQATVPHRPPWAISIVTCIKPPTQLALRSAFLVTKRCLPP